MTDQIADVPPLVVRSNRTNEIGVNHKIDVLRGETRSTSQI